MKKIQNILFFVTFLIISFFTVKNLIFDGYFPMHDDTQPTRIFLMKESIGDGQFPVRWVEHLGYGYGYPIFNFYAPLPYYLGGVISILGFDSIDSAKIILILVTSGSIVTMYFLMRQFINNYGSIVGASIYTLFPYHAVNTYVRGALSEQFGYLLIPLVLLSYLKVFENLNKKNLTIWPYLLGITTALLVISHNLSAIIAGVALFPIVLFHLISSKKRLFLFKNLFLSMVIAIGLSAFYLLPMILESKFTNVNSQIGGGADFRDHFVCLGQFWTGPWGFGGSTPGCNDGMSFRLGKTNIILFAAAVLFGFYSILIAKSKKENAPFYIGIVLTIVALFLMLPLSNWIWNIIPILEYIQYPWRFLTIAGVGMSLVIGFVCSRFSDKYKNYFVSIGLLCMVVAVTIFNNAKVFVPQEKFEKNLEHYNSISSIRYDISKISDEYMPKNFQKPKSQDEVPQNYINDSPTFRVSEIRSSSNNIEIKLNSFINQNVLLNIAPFPSWKFYIDGDPIKHNNNKNGIEISISQGEHIIEAVFHQTLFQIVGNILTIVTILGLGAGIMIKLYGKKIT